MCYENYNKINIPIKTIIETAGRYMLEYLVEKLNESNNCKDLLKKARLVDVAYHMKNEHLKTTQRGRKV